MGQLISAIAMVASKTAIHVEGDNSWTDGLKKTTKIATNIGLAPMIGVMRLASPLRNEMKQSIWEMKKRKPSKVP